jgi:hypothetical protein
MSGVRFFSICTFLCVILSTGRITASDNFKNALRIFSEGRYFLASIEFERTIFYETDNKRIAQCKYYKSLCFKRTGDTGRAIEVLGEINMFSLPDSLFLLVRYEQALCNFLNGDPNKSLWSLEEIKFRFPDTSEIINIIPLNILCLNSLRRWDDAQVFWKYYLVHSGLSDSVKRNTSWKLTNYIKKEIFRNITHPKKLRIFRGSFPVRDRYIAELFRKDRLTW